MNNNYIINTPYDPKLLLDFYFVCLQEVHGPFCKHTKNRNQAIILYKIEFINLSSSHFYEQ